MTIKKIALKLTRFKKIALKLTHFKKIALKLWTKCRGGAGFQF